MIAHAGVLSFNKDGSSGKRIIITYVHNKAKVSTYYSNVRINRIQKLVLLRKLHDTVYIYVY